MSEWISVETQMPPQREGDAECTVDVLAWTADHNMLAAQYIYDDADWYDMYGELISGVTHWMPLPSTQC